ncbi:MAG: hypothetical protein FWD91_03040 [Treponema sp.]|nr:hypothetical protein [Treponema sp.]
MKRFCLRIFALLIGLFLFSFGVVLTIKANIGYAPWEVFHVGLARTIGVSIGTISISIGVLVVVINILLGEKLGFATFLNMILVGLIVDLLFPRIPLGQNLIAGIIMLLAGVFSISIGTYFYLTAALGPGPRDGLMIALARKTGRSVGLCRFAIEFVVTIAGFFLGGMVGVGTVLFVVVIGFAVQITFKIFRFDATAVKHETMRDTCAALKAIRG